MTDELEVPREPSLNVPDLPHLKNIQIFSKSSEELKGLSDTKLAELKQVERKEREKCKERGDGGR